jgi:serine/threonine-protein kinase
VAGEEVVEEQRPRHWGPVVLVLLVVAAAVAVWYLRRDDEPVFVAVPEVVGLRERAAVQRLAGKGLTVSVQRRRHDRSVRGVVYEQQPNAGETRGLGSIATVFVAEGPATTAVPEVTGLPAGRAARLLRAANFRVARVPVVSRLAEGTVVSQFPRGGDRADWHASVRINVASEAGRLLVPDVLGRTEVAATMRLRAAGIVPQVVRVASAAPEGKVVRQSPVGGSRIAQRDGVRVEVSDGTGADPTVVPENPHTPVLLGFGEQEAVHELEALGYIVRVTRRHTADPREDGAVIEQKPSGGAPGGSVITIVVGDASG